MKKKFQPLALFLLTTMFTANQAFSAPGSYGTGTLTGGNGTTDAGSVTINAELCNITTDAMTTAADTAFTATIINSKITATSLVTATINSYSGNQGTPTVLRCTVTAGQVVINCYNLDAANALNGTFRIVLKVDQADANLVG